MTPSELKASLASFFAHHAVAILEPTKGSWVNDNNWGNARNQPMPETAGIVVSILPKNTTLYGPPHVHAVQLARGDETPSSNADVRARITYGCGGTTNTFDCDWLHGAQFSLVCNSLSVQAVTYAPRSTAPYAASTGSVFLAASVAKGSAQGVIPLTYTEARNTMQIAEVSDYPVRDFVKAFTLHVQNNNNPATATNVLIQFLDAGGGANAEYDAQVCAGGRSILIPGSTNVVRVRNNTGAVVLVTAQWTLGL